LLKDADLPPIGPEVWKDTQVLLPCDCRAQCRNILTGKDLDLITTGDNSPAEAFRQTQTRISVSAALSEFPVALCLVN
jgi:hypothetical protein